MLNPKPRREVKTGVAKQEYDFTLNLERVKRSPIEEKKREKKMAMKVKLRTRAY